MSHGGISAEPAGHARVSGCPANAPVKLPFVRLTARSIEQQAAILSQGELVMKVMSDKGREFQF